MDDINIGGIYWLNTSHQNKTLWAKSTYTLIKLSPLSSGDEAFAIRVPRHAGQTVFMGLGHFGPQLPRLLIKGIGRGG